MVKNRGEQMHLQGLTRQSFICLSDPAYWTAYPTASHYINLYISSYANTQAPILILSSNLPLTRQSAGSKIYKDTIRHGSKLAQISARRIPNIV